MFEHYISRMKKLIVPLFLMIPTIATADCVILVHGLARSHNSMLVMQQALSNADYNVVSISYPSTREPLEELVTSGLPQAIADCPEQKIHFVTHSMGGILVRMYLAQAKPQNLGRVVMLAPPNKGSELADKLKGWQLYEMINGPAGMALGTGEGSAENGLGSADFELGVIAGNRSLNPFYSAMIKGADDGKVSVGETKVSGMDDHIILPVTHTFMMNSPQVIAQTKLFLENGKFDPNLSYADAMLLSYE